MDTVTSTDNLRLHAWSSGWCQFSFSPCSHTTALISAHWIWSTPLWYLFKLYPNYGLSMGCLSSLLKALCLSCFSLEVTVCTYMAGMRHRQPERNRLYLSLWWGYESTKGHRDETSGQWLALKSVTVAYCGNLAFTVLPRCVVGLSCDKFGHWLPESGKNRVCTVRIWK